MDNDKDSQSPDQDVSRQPAPTGNNEAYSQYIDPDYQKKRKKRKLLLIIASVTAVLIVIIVSVVIAASLSSGDSNNDNDANTSANTVNVIETCEDEECFTERFSSCQPTKYEESEGNSRVEYEIPGIQNVGCIVSLKYVSNDDEEIVGKEMTCDFDNELDFYSSAELVFAYPDDYECEGSLVDYL
jgi:hypothetical protein